MKQLEISRLQASQFMRLLFRLDARSVNIGIRVGGAVLFAFSSAMLLLPLNAQPGEQRIVKQVNASKQWTSIVPMKLNSDSLTDLLSYNSTTGLAIYSLGTSAPGEQKIVKQVDAAKGWTSIIPMNLNNDGLTDLLSYNSTTGLAIYSVGTATPGE